MSYIRIERTLLANRNLSPLAKLVMALLLDRRNKETGKCNPKRKTIAKDLGLSDGDDKCTRTISRALAELQEAGLLRSKQGRRTRFYEFEPCQVGKAGDGLTLPNLVSVPCQVGNPYPAAPFNEPIPREPQQRPRAEARSRRGLPKDQAPNAPPWPTGTSRKPMGLADLFDPLNGRFLTKTQYDQLTLAVGLAEFRKKYGGQK